MSRDRERQVIRLCETVNLTVPRSGRPNLQPGGPRCAVHTTLCASVLIAAVAVLAHDRKREFHYIYVLDGGKQQVLSGGPLNIDNLERILHRYDGHFFWFSLDGRSYVIRDAATLHEIDKTFAPMRGLEPQHDAIRRRLDPLEQEERVIDRKLDALEESIDDENATTSKSRDVEAQQRELERHLRTIEEQMRVIEREEERFDRKLDTLEEEAERLLLPILRRAVRNGRAANA